MFNEIALVTITPFSGTTSSDKNGENPIMFQPIAGKIPNLKQVVSGTVARNLGVEIGHSYLMKVRENGYDAVHGLDFQWTKIQECTSIEQTIKSVEMLGEGQVISFDKPISDYIRKSDAIESQRTKRIKEGIYKPTNSTIVTNYESSANVKQGSSVKTDTSDLFPTKKEHLGPINR